MRGYNRGCHPVREVREGCSRVSEVLARLGEGEASHQRNRLASERGLGQWTPGSLPDVLNLSLCSEQSCKVRIPLVLVPLKVNSETECWLLVVYRGGDSREQV